MKKIKYIALGVFATLLSSCGNDWLDLQSSTAIETDGSLTELRDFEFVLNGAYSSMQSSSYYGADMFCYGDLRGDGQKEGDETNIERFVIGRSISMTDYATTRRLYSGDYVRLKNLTFGFTLPKTWTRKVGIDNIRLYASGNNLLTWAAYDYIDPESGSSPSWDTPPMRTYTFGLEVKF